MKDYIEFLKTKQTAISESGFVVSESELNDKLFPFQKYCVLRALKAGRFAMFEDCGLGKTIQQLEWADKVQKHIGFAPSDGRCYRCKRQIYSDGGISVEKASAELTTGCPFCHASFVD